jgi:hypothetical protein
MLDSLKLVIKMHRVDRERALNCDALINILFLAFGHYHGYGMQYGVRNDVC